MLGKAAPLQIRIIVDVLAAITALSLGLAGWGLYDRFNDTDERRAVQTAINARMLERDKEVELRFAAADRRQREVIRAVLCLAQATVLADEDRTEQDKRESVVFYSRALESIDMRPCGARE